MTMPSPHSNVPFHCHRTPIGCPIFSHIYNSFMSLFFDSIVYDSVYHYFCQSTRLRLGQTQYKYKYGSGKSNRFSPEIFVSQFPKFAQTSSDVYSFERQWMQWNYIYGCALHRCSCVAFSRWCQARNVIPSMPSPRKIPAIVIRIFCAARVTFTKKYTVPRHCISARCTINAQRQTVNHALIHEVMGRLGKNVKQQSSKVQFLSSLIFSWCNRKS